MKHPQRAEQSEFISAHHSMIQRGMIMLLISSIFFCSAYEMAEQESVIDSLETALETAGEDTGKVDILNELGWQYCKVSDYDKSLPYVTEALSLSEKLNYKKGMAIAHKNLGNNYSDRGENAEALNHYMISLKISEEIGDKQNIANCYFNIARVNQAHGNFSEALKGYLECLRIDEELGNKAGMGNTFNRISRLYIIQGDFDQALNYNREALEMNIEAGDNAATASSYCNIAAVYEMQGKYTEALDNLKEGLEYANESGDKYSIGSCYNQIGIVYLYQGNYAEALRNFTIQLKIFQEYGYEAGIANAIGNLAITYLRLGDLPMSLKYQLESLKLNEKLEYKNSIAISLLNIGNIYYEMGNDTAALEHYWKCLKICEETMDKLHIAKSLGNIALIYSDQKKFDRSSEFYQEALKIYNELGNKQGIASCYLNTGGLMFKMKNHSEAMKYYKLTLQLGEEIGNNPELAKAYIEMALVCFDRAKSESTENAMASYNEAFDCLNKGLSLSQEMGNKEYIKQCYEGLIKVDSAQGNFSLGLAHFRMYVIYKDSLLNENSQNQLALLKIQYETENKDKEIELLNLENDVQALQISKQKLQRNGAIISIAFLLVIGFLLFRSLHLRKKLEKQSAIIQERKRISADLHDDIGTGLSKISLLSELVRSQAKTPEAKKEAEKIADTSNELLQSIGEIIWALNANNDHLENLVAYIRRYAAGYFENSSVDLKINAPVYLPQSPVSGECRRNVFYAVKEAIHNIVKHAQASRAEINITLENSLFSVVIRDNGSGMPEGDLNRFGNGIRNMKNRMEKINGRFMVENDNGTKVTLALPL